MPQYMLLIYGPADGPPAGSRPEQSAKWFALTERLRSDGVFVAGDPLQGVDTATSVRQRNDEFQITDGPFAETREVLAGYYLLDCPDLDTALEYAKQCPNVVYGSTEVRPVMDMSALPVEGNQAQASA